jgi:universal stress protein A
MARPPLVLPLPMTLANLQEERVMSTPKTILVPTDFSPAAERALAYARELADGFGAAIHLLHVCEDPFAIGGFMDMYTPPSPADLERIKQRAERRLEELLTDDQKTRYAAVFSVRIGLPAQEILEYVRTHGAIDLIVLATGGRGLVARLMIGSVADKVVRQAPCPVVTLHPHDRNDTSTAPRAAA